MLLEPYFHYGKMGLLKYNEWLIIMVLCHHFINLVKVMKDYKFLQCCMIHWHGETDVIMLIMMMVMMIGIIEMFFKYKYKKVLKYKWLKLVQEKLSDKIYAILCPSPIHSITL